MAGDSTRATALDDAASAIAAACGPLEEQRLLAAATAGSVVATMLVGRLLDEADVPLPERWIEVECNAAMLYRTAFRGGRVRVERAVAKEIATARRAVALLDAMTAIWKRVDDAVADPVALADRAADIIDAERRGQTLEVGGSGPEAVRDDWLWWLRDFHRSGIGAGAEATWESAAKAAADRLRISGLYWPPGSLGSAPERASSSSFLDWLVLVCREGENVGTAAVKAAHHAFRKNPMRYAPLVRFCGMRCWRVEAPGQLLYLNPRTANRWRGEDAPLPKISRAAAARYET